LLDVQKMKKIYPHTDEWYKARAGRVTGSQAFRFLGGSAAQKTYLYELIEEVAIGYSRNFQSFEMEYGLKMEPVAISLYQLLHSNVEPSYFVIQGRYKGCTPDGFIHDDGIIEVKCPTRVANHIKYIEEGPDKKHYQQMMFNMYICEKSYCDFISYCDKVSPEKRLHVQRIEYDVEFIEDMTEKLDAFVNKLNTMMLKYISNYQ
jgi:hypothetical protein